jgi:hypothetical protein
MVCDTVGEYVSTANWNGGALGICARRGITAELNGQGTCEDVQQVCLANPEPDVPCTPETIPDCPDVSVTEYVTCRAAAIRAHLDSEAMISCETDPASLPVDPIPGVCQDPYARCPALTQ